LICFDAARYYITVLLLSSFSPIFATILRLLMPFRRLMLPDVNMACRRLPLR